MRSFHSLGTDMGKEEEYVAKKRNKAARKRLRHTVDFAHGVQAAKRRRKAGRRRVCEGMCYSLPTADDPFNDLYKERIGKRKANKVKQAEKDMRTEQKGQWNSKSKVTGQFEMSTSMKRGSGSARLVPLYGGNESKEPRNKISKIRETEMHGICFQSPDQCGNIKAGKITWVPVIERCLENNEMWTALGGDAFATSLCSVRNVGFLANTAGTRLNEKASKGGKRKMMASKWDWQFWEACGTGLDVLATGRAPELSCQTHYVLAAAAHIAAKRHQNPSCQNPMVLFVLQSQEHTLQVRNNCKLLKQAFNIHSVSLHAGTSLQRQIEGLNSVSPEILVATPDRLSELICLDAISISNVSFMVVDGFESLISCGFGDLLQKIRASVDASVQTAVLSGSISYTASNIAHQMLKDPISRVTSDNSLVEQSACIAQEVSVIVSEEKRLQKLVRLLRQHFEKQQNGASLTGVLILFRQSQVLFNVKAAIQDEGYIVGCLTSKEVNGSQPNFAVLEQFRKGQVDVLLLTEDVITEMDISAIRTVINYEFPTTIDVYRHILTGMARHTMNGVLHSFCSGAAAPLALQLMDVLLQCLQPVPPSLTMLGDAATAIEQQYLVPPS